MAGRSMTWDTVLRRRLRRHHLSRPAPAQRLVDVVGEVCGIHAQVPLSSDLSIGARVDGITRSDVHRELWERRTLIRTYGVRGTVHLLPAKEMPMWLAAFNAERLANAEVGLQSMGIDQARMDQMVEAIGEALDGRRLTRQELTDEVAARVGAWAAERAFPAFGGMEPRLLPAIGTAARAGIICFGPSEGNRVTFVRLDQWAPDAARRRPGRTAALAEVLRRYLHAYGPATAREFAQWFFVSFATAEAAARELRDQLVDVDVQGDAALMLADDAGGRDDRARAGDRSVRLLPSFDVYVVGSHPRDMLIPPSIVEHAGRHRASLKWATAGRAQFAGPIPVLLIDGREAGMWERTTSGRRMDVKVEPFVKLTKAQLTELEAEADQMGRFLDAEPTLAVGPLR
jgi:hypothetical protein